jgi:hypothetical protein
MAGVAEIVAGAQKRGLDPFAVVAVAQTEGLSGGIGDGGHAFGPFQLNDAGGAFPASVQGTPEQKNAWAWSDAGVNYALDRMALVARGLKGQAAVINIVSRFERPANIPSEISRAGNNYSTLTRYTGNDPSKIAGHIGVHAGGNANTEAGATIVGGAKHIPGVQQAFDAGSFLGKLSDPSYLLRGMQIVAGAALVLTGVVLLTRQVALAADLPLPPVAGPAGAALAAGVE